METKKIDLADDQQFSLIENIDEDGTSRLTSKRKLLNNRSITA